MVGASVNTANIAASPDARRDDDGADGESEQSIVPRVSAETLLVKRPMVGRSGSVELLEYPLDAVDGPVELVPGDDQRRGEPDDIVVGFLAEQTVRL